MEGFPAAFVIASRADVAHNNNVLFRLVHTVGSELQSVNRMVNVVPFRRVYCFERAMEVDEFLQEILRRPLVLQPLLHFGRGFGPCGACYDDEQWVVMVNQTHPKILSRLQMGLNMAKIAIQRGQSVELKFRFGKAIEKVYKEHLKQKEAGEAKSKRDACLVNFRFAEWEHADLTIRFYGYAAKLGRTSYLELENLKMNWNFEDIGMHEMVWNQLEGQAFSKPHMAPVSEDEIRATLPTWTINAVSPLEVMGDAVPEHTYSYAQAGRLYESFRKKKRQRDRVPSHDHNEREAFNERPMGGEAQRSPHPRTGPELEGAVGWNIPTDAPPEYVVEHEFGASSPHTHPSRSWRKYQNCEDPLYPAPIDYERERSRSTNSYGSHHDNFHHAGYSDPDHFAQNPQPSVPYANYDHTDRPGQVHVDVHTNIPSNSLPSPYSPVQQSPLSLKDNSSHGPSSHAEYHMNGLKKQDSDRSSASTNADSGFHAEMDGARSRGDSYDFNEGYGQKYMNVPLHSDKMPLGSLHNSPEGLENPGFHMDAHDRDDAFQRHKELVAKMIQQQSGHVKEEQQEVAKNWALGESHYAGHFSQGYQASSKPASSGNKTSEQLEDTFV